MEIDLSIYLGAFLDEVDEQLQILEEEVLKLEQGNESPAIIQNIFRAAHTLKGSSAAMGMEKMKELTHNVENVFDLIRNHQVKVNTDLINVIFESIDMIQQLKEAIVDGTIDSKDITELMAKLDSFKLRESERPQIDKKEADTNVPDSGITVFPEVILDEYQKDMVTNALELGMNVMAVYVALNEQAMLKSVRALLIHNNLKEIGEIIASFPISEVIEDETAFDGNVVYLLVTDSKSQEVLNIVNSISDIKTIHLTSLTTENLEHFCAGKKIEVIEKKSSDIEAAKEKSDKRMKVQQTVRVDVERLESLMNLVGELVIGQTRLADVRGRLANRYSNDPDMIGFDEVTNQLGKIISDLQEGMMKTRMLPIEQLFNRFPRMVRDTAQKSAKEVHFVIEGKETELDRNLIEEISDPIIHLLRNSVDHGIESPEERERLGKSRQGTVVLKAAHEESHIVITISDDGKGIDVEKIKQSAIKKQHMTIEEAEKMSEKDLLFLIFKSGVSTAKKVTDISGRGVGMDIVRSHIEKLNGIIDIHSVVGKGSTFTIKLPLTLAIIRSLLVRIGSKQFAIPLVNVQEIIRLKKDEISTIHNQEIGIVRDRVLPLVWLHSRLNASVEEIEQKKRLLVVVIGLAEKRVGIMIDQTLGNQEIVIKPLGKYIGKPKYIAGATIMGDGNVALILDVASIVKEEGTKISTVLSGEKDKPIHEKTVQLTTFMLGEEEYGIDIDQVHEIITVPAITPILNAPFSVMGMINLRGRLIPVMDVRKRFGQPPHERSRKSRIIVVEIKHELIGFMVDQVKEVLKINEKRIEKSSNYEGQVEDTKYIQGIYHSNERLIILLDINRILEIEELVALMES